MKVFSGTANEPLAHAICDYIGIIHQGRLLAGGSLAELRQRTRQADLEEIFIQMVEAAP